MREIKIDEVVYYVPGSWGQLSKKQLIFLATLILSGELSMTEIKLKLLLNCMKAKVTKDVGQGYYIIKTKSHKHVLTSQELAVLTDIFDFLFLVDDVNGVVTIKPDLTNNPFKTIRVFGCKLYGPNDMLDNITYDQYVWLQTWMSQMNSNPGALDKFIGVIYQSKGKKRRYRLVKHMSIKKKTVILWFVMGSLDLMQEIFKYVFEGGTSGTNINVFDNQQRIIDGLAKGDVTKKNQVRKSMLYDAMYVMDEAAKKQKELEKQYKKK